MSITVKTVYDEAALLEYGKHRLGKYKRTFWILFALVDAVILFAIALNIAAFGVTFENISFAAAAVVVNAFALIAVLAMPRINARRAAAAGTVVTVTFLEEKLLYTAASNTLSEQGEIPYSSILRATRGNTLYCLSVGSNAAFLVSKAGLSDAGVTPSEFESLLLRTIGQGRVRFAPQEKETEA